MVGGFQDCCVIGFWQIAAATDEVQACSAVIFFIHMFDEPFQVVHLEEKIYCLGLCRSRELSKLILSAVLLLYESITLKSEAGLLWRLQAF